MKNWYKVSLLSCALLIAANAEATWGDYGTITNVEANNGFYRVWFTNVSNPAGCTGSLTSMEAWDGETQQSLEAMQKIVMAAFLSGKEVRFSVHASECSSNNLPVYGNVRMR